MNSSRWLVSCLIVLVLTCVSSSAFAQVSISVNIAPPPLIIEDQPPIPDDGYIWTPGYWTYDEDQGVYYWVPGAWVQPPEVGLYWTPSYWGWENDTYVYYPGYWGPTVGFYGGINYGHGYWGNGYGGGRWDNGHFAYNSEANNVSGGRVHNTYADRSAVRAQSARVSFNGGKGGVQAHPTPQEQQASQQSHVQPTAQQQTQLQTAAQTRSHQVKVNANANKPAGANASQPAGSTPFTGQNAQEQKKDAGALTTPPQHEPQASPNEQRTPEEKPQVRNEGQPSPASITPEVKPPQGQGNDHPESHAPQQGPGAEVKHDKPAGGPESHPQAQPHSDAKPQGNASAKPEGQGKPDSHQDKDNGQH